MNEMKALKIGKNEWGKRSDNISIKYGNID
jgi:hypothetical protein